MRSGNPLIDLWLALSRGESPEAHPASGAPPHLSAVTWVYVCPCNVKWTGPPADAVWRDGGWRAPARQCLICHAWPDGHPVEPPNP